MQTTNALAPANDGRGGVDSGADIEGGAAKSEIRLLNHVILGVNDVTRAVGFYDAVLGVLGYKRRWIAESGAGYGTHNERGIDTFWLNKPIDGRPENVGNGTKTSPA